MAKAVKTPKTNAMRELESAGISYVLHTYEDDGDESVGLGVAISEQLGEEPGQGFKNLVCVTPPTTMSCAASLLPTSSI